MMKKKPPALQTQAKDLGSKGRFSFSWRNVGISMRKCSVAGAGANENPPFQAFSKHSINQHLLPNTAAQEQSIKNIKHKELLINYETLLT